MTGLRALLRLIAVLLRPGRTNAARQDISTEDYLKPLVILIIVLVAGPDIVAAIELTTLLELLGAAMFLLSFAVGFKLLGFSLLEQLRRLLLPIQYVTLVKIRGRPAAKIRGVLFICRHNLGLCCLVFAWIVAVIQLVR